MGLLAVLSYLVLDFLTGLVVGYFVLLVNTNRKPNRQRVLVIALIWTVMSIIIDGIIFLIRHKEACLLAVSGERGQVSEKDVNS